MPDPCRLYLAEWDAAELQRRHPPRLANRSKVAAHEHLMAAGAAPAGTVTASRWESAGLPAARSAEVTVRAEPEFFRYDDGVDAMAWHVNFAAHDLFCAYGTALLAQDELQVLEHPALASVREALRAEGRSTLVVERGRGPTPILVTGVERRGHLDTAPSKERPRGLYGNEFAACPVPRMLEALAPLVPPTTSHIIAIEAPPGGSGRYTVADIAFILETATAGFRAAVLETRRMGGGRVVVHTGWWGCGAYGGNRELMGVLQLEAAALAGIDELVFHTGDPKGAHDFETVQTARASLDGAGSLQAFIERLAARGLRWGVSNGT